MWRNALLVATKDLKIEARSKIGLGQVAPFALAVLLLFGFALDPDRGFLTRSAPGLFWMTVLLSAMLAVQRSFAIEAGTDGMRASGLDPASIFLGKAAALLLQLLILEVLLTAGVVVLFDVSLHSATVLLATGVLAGAGIAAAATVYGALSAGMRVSETLLPLLFLPAVAPVLLAATRATEGALEGSMIYDSSWLSVLVVFATIYVAAGTIAFGPLLEEV